MQLNSNDLFLLSQCAISAAYQAGQIISQFSNKALTVKTKEGASSLASQVVTEVDHLCEDIILQTLTPSCDIFDLAILSEESPDNLERLEKDFFWCIDPLDGTLSFIRSTSGYSVSIALVSREGIPYIGVIYDPVEKILYSAIKGCGAFQNGKVFSIKSSKKNKLTIVADPSFKEYPHFATVESEINKISAELGYDDLSLLMKGGAVMNACWVLENSPACYFKFPKPKGGGGLMGLCSNHLFI